MYKITHIDYTKYNFVSATEAILWALTEHNGNIGDWIWEKYE